MSLHSDEPDASSTDVNLLTHPNPMNDEAPVMLTGREMRALRYASRQMRKKIERGRAKSTFVPEPGHNDVNDLKIAAHQSAEQKLEEAMARLRRGGTSWTDDSASDAR